MLLTSVLEEFLKVVKELVKELLSISLDTRVCWLAIKLLERKAEFGRVNHGSFAELQMAEEQLQLAQHIVIDHALFVFNHVRWGLIDDFEKTVSKSWNPVELLQH